MFCILMHMEEIYNPHKRNKQSDFIKSNNQLFNNEHYSDDFYNPNKKNKIINNIQSNNDLNIINSKIDSILSSLSDINSKICSMQHQINIILHNQEQFIISKNNEETHSNEIFKSYIN